MRFQVELLGSEFLVEHFGAAGTLVNISRRGMLAEVDRLLAVGAECIVSLVNGDDLVYPSEMRGQVRRSRLGHAGWQIGIEFDALVELLPWGARAAQASEVRVG